jgi:hypothetical protein
VVLPAALSPQLMSVGNSLKIEIHAMVRDSLLQGACIGDVFVSTGKIHHDRRIPLPGFDKQVSRTDTLSSIPAAACPLRSACIHSLCCTAAQGLSVWQACVSGHPVSATVIRRQNLQPT